MITDIKQLDLSKRYTYSDYLSWKFDERVELIKGKIFRMSPAPKRNHQVISRNIFGEIYLFQKGRKCDVFHAPFDVKLSMGDDSTVVQPDICVICDESKLTEQGCTGAPELIIEILSPGNSKKEMKNKFDLYEENGVLEYWIVDPSKETVVVYSLNEAKRYIGSKPFVDDSLIDTEVLSGIELRAEQVFEGIS